MMSDWLVVDICPEPLRFTCQFSISKQRDHGDLRSVQHIWNNLNMVIVDKSASFMG